MHYNEHNAMHANQWMQWNERYAINGKQLMQCSQRDESNEWHQCNAM